MAMTTFPASFRAVAGLLSAFALMSNPIRAGEVPHVLEFNWQSGREAPSPNDPPVQPPLPDTFNNQPIDPSSTTASDVMRYVDQEMQARDKLPTQGMSNPAQFVSHSLTLAMARAVTKFGAANLLEAYRRGPNPQVHYTSANGMIDNSFYLQSCELRIILEGLVLAVTDDDLPKLLDLANTDPNILSVVLSKDTWRSDPRVQALVLATLDATEPDKCPTFTPDMVAYAASSAVPEIQNKLAGRLQGWLDDVKDLAEDGSASDQDSPSSKQVEARLLDSTMIACLAIPNSPCVAIFPAFATARKDVASRVIINPLTQELMKHPEGFASAPVSEGALIFTQSRNWNDGPAADRDFLAAGAGDKNSFKELVQAYAELYPAAGGFIRPDQTDQENPPPMKPANAASPLFSGAAAMFAPRMISMCGKSLMQIIIYKGNGDKLAAVVRHLDDAVYAKGQWTVTDGPDVANPAVPAPATNGAPATVSPAAQPTSTAPVGN
jgi:hypothetical protein